MVTIIDDDIPAPKKQQRMAIAEPVAVKPAKALAKNVRILLEESDEIPPTGQFFSVNDRSYVLRPGEPADVPEELVEVLDNAIQDVPIKHGDKIMGYKQRLRFPYRVLERTVN